MGRRMTYHTNCAVDLVDRFFDVDSSVGAEHTGESSVKLEAGGMESLDETSRKL